MLLLGERVKVLSYVPHSCPNVWEWGLATMRAVAPRAGRKPHGSQR